ncbi:MAG TPA: hypothetical protein VG734_07110 [Lacunisphaera sp.]|nr:hypothetical protein [Lacunisphaera sp.]
MISWIQKYFQKHFRLVFIAVLVAVALPMVVIYSTSGGGRGDTNKVLERSFFGVNLANPAQARRVFADGELSGFLRLGYAGLQGGQLQQYALQRVAGMALADDLHLPLATPEDVAKYVPTLRAFQNEQGVFDNSRYTRFGDSLKTPGGPFTAADVLRVLQEDVRLESLTNVLGGPGYILPADVKQQLSLLDSVWTAQVATLDYASFNPAINPTEEVLKKFHDENAFRYDVPVRPKLSYVEFKNADFVPPGAPSEAELRAFYNSNISSFPVPPDPEKKDATAAAAATTDNFPKVRDQVEKAVRDMASQRAATQAASDLTAALYDRKATIKPASAELTAFLASQHRTAVPLAPFVPEFPPADKSWLGSYAEPIARLNADRFFSDPLPTPDGVVVLLWQENLPAYKPLFSEVRDRVVADYRESEKRRLFIERGNALKTQLQAAAKTPAGFTDTAKAEKLEVKAYANFTVKQPPSDLPQPALSTLVQLSAGQVSDFVGLGDKGILVFAQEKKLPELTPANPRYSEVQKDLMDRIARNNGSVVLADMIAQEGKKIEATDVP